VLPPDFRKIRHYGLYAPGPAGERRAAAAMLLGGAASPPVEDEPDERLPVQPAVLAWPACPCCGGTTRHHSLPATQPALRWATLPRGPPWPRSPPCRRAAEASPRTRLPALQSPRRIHPVARAPEAAGAVGARWRRGRWSVVRARRSPGRSARHDGV